MPFTEPNVPISGRTSRASAFSDMSRRTAPPTGIYQPGDMFSAAAPGVLSMLKTSTDIGDLGAFPFNSKKRLPAPPRPAHQRKTHVARLSGSSHHTNLTTNSLTASQPSRMGPSPQPWDSAPANPRGSLTSLTSMTPYMPDTMSPTLVNMSNNAPYGLPQPSMARDGRSYSLTQAQAQPARRLMSYRSTTSLRSQEAVPRHMQNIHPAQRPQYVYPTRLKRPGYRPSSPLLSDYGPAPPTRGPYVRAPPRPYLTQHHSDYGHQNMPSRPMHFGVGPQQMMRAHASTPPMMTYEQNNFAYRPGPMRPAPVFQMSRRGLPVPPPRAFTPQMDSLPSSSEPGSSAPPSSNPPTPRDVTSVQVAIDPGFGDPELSELPSSNSDSNGLANYVAYADALEKEADLNQITTAVPMGFVQRIKNLLEEKATADEAIGNKDPSPRQAPAVNVIEIVQDGPVELPGSMPSQSVQDLVELPATPVAAPAELAGTPVKRITRDMITAITAPSESGTASEQNTAAINTNLDNGIEVQMSIKQTVEKADDSSSHYPSEDSTDSSPQSHNGRSSSPVETTTTVTMTNSSQLSGGDYAVHLEIPEFTASKMRQEVEPGPDELVLQNDHEREGEASTPDDTESEIADRSSTPLPTEPVSPLRSDENTDRNSVVSPMATKTPGQRSALEGVQQMPGAFPNQGDTPPTPRRKSKSVSFPLPPSADTTSRYSLPSDLNHSNEATGTTDFMTDVAVRFTVPPSASTGKPQVVQIRSSPESSTTNSTVTVRKDVYELPAFNSPRASYADKVPPLVIRKPESAVITTSTSNTESADLSCFIRRSFPRRQSVYFDDQPESKRSSRDSTTDLRFSNHKYQSIGHLPGLKEESQEDMRTSDPDMRSSSFSFPLPRTLATKAGHERLRQSEDFSATKRRSSKQPGMSLSEIHELPSLNFSRMDLIEKLNQALDIRSSVSLDVGRGRRFSGLYHPIPQRPASTEHLRERYTSFFVKPEEIEIPEPVDDEESSGQVTPEESAKEEEQKNPEEDGKATRPVSTMSKRPMSPEELLNVATEVSRLSIPSVTGLTERLSELLPSIKRLHLDSAIGDDEAVGHTIDEIHHLGERPETMMSVRSSGGLRLMAAAADKIVTNGTHDSTQMDAKVSRLMKELPPLPESADSVSEMSSAEPRNSSSSKQTRSPVSELEAPQPAFIRKSSVKEDSTAEALQPPPKLTSKRSLIISSPSSRPWNADESYPWSGTKLPVDLSFPEPAHHRNSITSDSVRSPVRVSLESTRYLDDTTRSRNVVSPGSVISDLEHATVTTEALTGHARKFSKRSIMGSITRKIGIGRDSPMLNRKRTTSRDMRSPLRSPDVLSLDDAVDPGDRYPTTALTSPTTALHLGETRSFFSDDSSEERREEAAAKRGSFRKHISHLKARLPPHLSPPTPPPRGSSLEQDGTRSLDFIGHGGASLNDSRITVQSVAVTYDAGVGMSKMEFRVKRVAERIKCLWARGGELLRSLSGRGGVGRSKVEREGDVQGMSRDEWLADSLYSGSAA